MSEFRFKGLTRVVGRGAIVSRLVSERDRFIRVNPYFENRINLQFQVPKVTTKPQKKS